MNRNDREMMEIIKLKYEYEDNICCRLHIMFIAFI